MKVSSLEKRIGRNSRIGYAQSDIPFFSIREAFFQGVGYNRLHHNNSLFMSTRSIHDREDLQQKFGFKCDVNPDFIQLDYKYLVVKYEPICKKTGKMTIALNVDSKMDFLPMFIIDKISGDFGKDFFKNIVRISKEFKGSEWEKNVEKEPELFNFFK